MEIAAANPPVWKYQRQFDYADGVATLEQRPSLLRDTPSRRLSDEQVRAFLANGHLTLQPELPAGFHREMFERFVGLIGDDNDFNPGNNLLPVVPELQLVFDDPVIKGALTSVLGEGYMMHPHRVLHDNPPGSDQQVWHHDSYWGYKRKGPQPPSLVGDDHVLPPGHLRAHRTDRGHPGQPVHRAEARRHRRPRPPHAGRGRGLRDDPLRHMAPEDEELHGPQAGSW